MFTELSRREEGQKRRQRCLVCEHEERARKGAETEAEAAKDPEHDAKVLRWLWH